MTTHDDLCPVTPGAPTPPCHCDCQCALIARARADEQKRIFDGIGKDREITARVMDETRADERERIAKTWQVNGWTVLMPAVAEAKKRGGNVIIAAAQAVTDWLREGGDADDWADWDAIAKTEGDMFAIRDLVKDAIHDAAAITRGEQP